MTGASAQVAPQSDLQVADAVRNHLFQNVHKDTNGNAIPGDLIARNIQRGRDHGIPGYAELRKVCNMKPLSGTTRPAEIESATWSRLMTTYKNEPDQIDGFTGGLAETAPSDGKVGPLFACILGTQFKRLRDGDRFFFTHGPGNKAQGLKSVTRNNILDRSLGAIFCDNLNPTLLKAKTLGKDVFRQHDSISNPELDCGAVNMKLNLAAIFAVELNDLPLVEDPTTPANQVRSPLHPEEYPHNIDEVTSIEVPAGSKIQLTFNTFDLEKDPFTEDCRFDFVEIKDGPRILERLCGKLTKRTFTSSGNKMTVRFHSDASLTSKGFSATWKRLNPNQPSLPQKPTPPYDNGYGSDGYGNDEDSDADDDSDEDDDDDKRY